MGLELRKGRQYYYRKERIGNRVLSRYMASGSIAQQLAAVDREVRELQEQERTRRKARAETARSLIEASDAACSELRTIVAGLLTEAGFHSHKGEWRKRRDHKIGT